MSATRRKLSFATEDEVIADVERLRKGCIKTGSWTLAQTAHHLNKAVQARMKAGPFAADTEEQKTMRAAHVPQILASGQLPSGLPAPDFMIPPIDTPDAAIDELIASLKQMKAFKGPIAPHRIFGQIPDADARKVNLIHCAHHLSYLVPIGN